MAKRWAWAVIFGICLGGFSAPIDWPHLKLTRIAEGLAEPIRITHAGDGSGRLFIAERHGRIKVLSNGEVLPEPFLDISSKVDARTHYSYGILGVAFPPQFALKQYFYVHYTRAQEQIVLSRFHVPPGSSVASPESEEVLTTTSLPLESFPHGGHLEFGPDGYLYVGFSAPFLWQPQALNNLAGKIHRIDPESPTGYAIPPDNPFAGHPTNRNEIWCSGFLLPYHFSFDRLTGDLFIIDKRVDGCEINFQGAPIKGGGDYGWPNPERSWSPLDYGRYGATPPVLSLHYPEPRAVGGYVYRGYPTSRMNGIYVFGGLGFAGLAGLALEGTNWVMQHFHEAGIVAWRFGEDEEGGLYVASYDDGRIHRIDDSGVARAPVIYPPGGVSHTAVATLTSLNPGARIRFTTDGRDPEPGDLEVESGHPVPIAPGTTIKAQAFRDDLQPSGVAVAVYSDLKVATPAFSHGQGHVTNRTSITLTSATPQAFIRYTRDGTQPTVSSPIYKTPLVITGFQVIRARAYRAGFQPSDLNRATYELAVTAPATFMPDYSPITNGTLVTLSCATTGAVIRFTTNGVRPTSTSPQYTEPFRVNGNTLMQTIAFADAYGYLPSQVLQAWYALIPVPPPVFDRPDGPVAYGTMVRLSCPLPGAIVRYTTNNTDPGPDSPIYSAPIPIYDTTYVRARAYKPPDYDPSAHAAAGYYLQYVMPPVFTPGQGPLKKYTPIAISTEPRLAQIRYTLDGSVPDTNSPLYRRPIVADGPITLSARAYAFGYNSSAVTVTYFASIDQESTIVQTLAGTGQPGLVNGPGGQAQFRSPHALCVNHEGTVFVADTGNHVIRAIGTNGVVRTLVGSGDPASWDAVGTNSSFAQPTAITVDASNNLYVADSLTRAIRLVKPDLSVRSITYIPPGSGALWQIQLSSTGWLYLGGWAHIISIAPSLTIGLFAGPAVEGRGWMALTAVGLDSADHVFAVTGYQLLTFDGLTERSLAGSVRGFSDGPGPKARFTAPNAITIGKDNTMFITDDHLVRFVNTNGYVSTLAGYGTRGFRNGPSSIAQFAGNTGICVDKNGVVYVADANNHSIRKISFDRDQDTIPDPEDPSIGIDDRLIDADGDGQSNAAEFWAATDPNNANSTLKLESRYASSNSIALSWPTAPGRTYSLVASTNLTDWPITLPPIPGDGTIKSATNSTDLAPRQFYRLRVDP